MRVTEAVGQGKVRVRLSFPEWKEGKVAPANYEIPVHDLEAKSGSSE